MTIASRVIATSLRQASRNARNIQVLDLSSGGSTGDALQCKNIMCSKLGGPCVCRLAKYLWEQPLDKLDTLNLESNNLELLPDPVFTSLPNLKHLDASNNKLTEIPESVSDCVGLETLKLSGNSIKKLPVIQLSMLQHLKLLDVRGNPDLLSADLSSALPQVRVLCDD